MKKAVFLDRDGTLIEERDYLSDPDGVSLVPRGLEAMRLLSSAGYLLFIVTNQSGVGRGYFSMLDVERVHGRLLELLRGGGVRVEKIYVAPEAPGQPSRGRKPSPQFLFDARDEFGIDLSESYFIGDKLIDLECGWNGGVKKSVLVRTGYGEEVARSGIPELQRALVAVDLWEAARQIAGETLANSTEFGRGQ